jgi:AcrR family transcriptional regulator
MNGEADLTQERKGQIHSAALVCFGRKGYHQATMDDIVLESGLSKGALYWYFPSKKELFISLLDSAIGQFGRDWEDLLSSDDLDAEGKLRTSISFFKTEMVKMSPMIVILLEAWSLLRHDEEVKKRVTEFYKPYVEVMTEIIGEGIAGDEFVSDSPAETALVIITLFDGLLLAISTGLDLGDWDQVLDAAEVFVLRGLGVRSKRIE